MIGADASRARAAITTDFQAALPRIDRRLDDWFRAHLVAPRPISLARKSDGGNPEQFWLLTDHTGSDDSGFRLVYDDVANQYGIECTIQNGVCLFAGYRATLTDALTDIKFFR